MSDLALKNLAEYAKENYFVKNTTGNRLLLHLFKPTTSPETAELFREQYLSRE